MPSLKLTKTAVEAEQPGSADRFLWDTSLRGFGVKITPNGAKVFLSVQPEFWLECIETQLS